MCVEVWLCYPTFSTFNLRKNFHPSSRADLHNCQSFKVWNMNLRMPYPHYGVKIQPENHFCRTLWWHWTLAFAQSFYHFWYFIEMSFLIFELTACSRKKTLCKLTVAFDHSFHLLHLHVLNFKRFYKQRFINRFINCTISAVWMCRQMKMALRVKVLQWPKRTIEAQYKWNVCYGDLMVLSSCEF